MQETRLRIYSKYLMAMTLNSATPLYQKQVVALWLFFQAKQFLYTIHWSIQNIVSVECKLCGFYNPVFRSFHQGYCEYRAFFEKRGIFGHTFENKHLNFKIKKLSPTYIISYCSRHIRRTLLRHC